LREPSLPSLPSRLLGDRERPRMTISNIRPIENGWMMFDLNVGGFVIKRCKWKPATGSIKFPVRRTKNGGLKPVIHAYGAFVRRVRALLESGEARTPRDRTPCELRIHGLREVAGDWWVFGFTVRGVTIWGCRYKPQTGSIQLPVTFSPGANHRKRVVHAPGVHINRLRKALLEQAQVEDRWWAPQSSEAELVGVT
jgi:hypothetical protein